MLELMEICGDNFDAFSMYYEGPLGHVHSDCKTHGDVEVSAPSTVQQ